jgi:hypothetical protein
VIMSTNSAEIFPFQNVAPCMWSHLGIRINFSCQVRFEGWSTAWHWIGWSTLFCAQVANLWLPDCIQFIRLSTCKGGSLRWSPKVRFFLFSLSLSLSVSLFPFPPPSHQNKWVSPCTVSLVSSQLES